MAEGKIISHWLKIVSIELSSIIKFLDPTQYGYWQENCGKIYLFGNKPVE